MKLTGNHRSPQHGWSKLTPRSCRGTDTNCGGPHEHKQGWTCSRTDEKTKRRGVRTTLSLVLARTTKFPSKVMHDPYGALFCAHWATTALARASVIRSLHHALTTRAYLFRGRCVPFMPTATCQQDKSTQRCRRALHPFVSSSFILTVSTIAHQLPECTRRAPCQRTNCCRSSCRCEQWQFPAICDHVGTKVVLPTSMCSKFAMYSSTSLATSFMLAAVESYVETLQQFSRIARKSHARINCFEQQKHPREMTSVSRAVP